MISVLLPVDGSEGSTRAVQMVIKLYQRLAPVEVRLLHVRIADGVPEGALANAPGGRASAREALEPAQKLLAQAGVPFTSDVRSGYVPPAIVEYAKSMNCDAIVMGTRGMGSGGEVVGSIARQVISLCDIPVTLVK
jgi:nucleotide-binding universal stress UspA family protein